MSLYKCPECERYYTIPTEFITKMDDECKAIGCYEALIICGCGEGVVTGGDGFEEGIYLFSHAPKKDITYNQ